MKTRFIILLHLVIGIQQLVISQSVYHFQYKYSSINDPVTYHSILIAYEYGGGLLRVRYTEPNTKKDVLAEMDIEQEDLFIEPGKPDSNKIVYKGSNLRYVYGSSSACFNIPSFIFEMKYQNDYYEPVGVKPITCVTSLLPDSFILASFKARTDLSKNFVSQFFSEDDDFYQELFYPKTRSLSAIEKKIRMHLILVGDTLDKKIGPACAGDIRKVKDTYTSLASFLGIKNVFVTTLVGRKYSIQNVQAAVKGLKVMPDDIVIFYYSGHGFSRPEMNKRFPYMKLKSNDVTKKELLANSMNIEDIFLAIKRKNARFNLVISDCCNDAPESSNSIGTRIGKIRSSGLEWSEANCKSLFMNPTPMSILATGADKDQRSSSNNTFGSFFTYFLKASMENYFTPKNKFVTWDLVLQDAKAKTTHKANYTICEGSTRPRGACFQEPYYKIIFGR